MSVLLWYPVIRLVRKGQSLHWGLWTGGAFVLCVALFLLHFPYRLLLHNKTFEAVNWGAAHCYVIGEREGDLLLFCPELNPPRNRIVPRADGTLTRLGITESVFRQYGARAGDPARRAPAVLPAQDQR